MIVGLLLIVLGGLTLVEYAVARDLGIDQVLFHEWHGANVPGRMGDLVRFHAARKLTLLAHVLVLASPPSFCVLGIRA